MPESLFQKSDSKLEFKFDLFGGLSTGTQLFFKISVYESF